MTHPLHVVITWQSHANLNSNVPQSLSLHTMFVDPSKSYSPTLSHILLANILRLVHNNPRPSRGLVTCRPPVGMTKDVADLPSRRHGGSAPQG